MTMTSLTRLMSWMVAIGNRGATANAWRAIEERAQAEAALDALSARMNVAHSGDAQSGDAAPSRAA